MKTNLSQGRKLGWNVITTFALFLLSSSMAFGQITGENSVCRNEQQSYSIPASPGSSGTWYVSNGTIVTQSDDNASIFWDIDGAQTITHNWVAADGTVTSATYDVTVNPLPTPEIITFPELDCGKREQHDNPGGDGQGISCLMACDSSVISYSVADNPGSTYSWSATGDILSTNAVGNTFEVIWGAAGFGTVKVIETNSFLCSDSSEVCVEIIESPDAGIQSPQDIVGGVITICLNQSVILQDNSEGASSWLWNFGDGVTSSMEDPLSHPYTIPGTYTVTLEVANECGCIDTTSLLVVVEATPGPEITCASVVCEGDTAEYTTSADCPTYLWDTDGGAIVSGAGTNTITVVWGSGASGPGIVSLDVDGCSGYCDQPTLIQIPIIPSAANIDGDTVLCYPSSATYSVPKIPGATYNWSFSGGFITSGQGTHEVTVYANQLGAQTIGVSYENALLDCGGIAKLDIEVKESFNASGPATVCEFDASSIFSSQGFPSYSPATTDWSVQTPDGTILTGLPGSSGVSSFTGYDFSAGPGIYIIFAENTSGDYCNEIAEHVVNVVASPAPPTVDGAVLICPGGTQIYTAGSSDIGTTFTWQVVGGTLNTTAGNPVTVTWDDDGPYSISAAQVMGTSPFCESPYTTLTVDTIPNPTISGIDTVCVNGVTTYSIPDILPGATYQWEVSLATMGSVISGQGTNTIDVQWLNSAGSATIELTIAECPNIYASYDVEITPAPSPIVTGPDEVCTGGSITLNSSEPSNNSWFNSSNTLIGSGSSVNITSGGIYQLVNAYGPGCSGNAFHTVTEIPAPVASISGPAVTVFCGTATVPMIDLIALTGAGYSYQWYQDGSLMPGETGATLTTNVPGSYYVIVTAGGCSETSNTIIITYNPNCGGDCAGTGSINFTTDTPVCNPLGFYGSVSANFTSWFWDFDDPASGVNNYSTDLNPTHNFSNAGYYNVEFGGFVPNTDPTGPDSCYLETIRTIRIPIVADFDINPACAGDSTSFNDLSTYVPNTSITNYTWDFGDLTPPSNDPNPSHAYGAAGTYNVTLTITNDTCTESITKTVVIEDLTAGFTYSPNPACENSPIDFADNSTSAQPIVSWNWNFGDGTSSLLEDVGKSFTPDGTYNVTLTVTNSLGCVDSITQAVNILPAPAAGTITGDTAFCYGSTGTITAPGGASDSFVWSTGETTQSITVATGGDYTVTVTNSDGCSATTPPYGVAIIPATDVSINGETIICEGDALYLYTGLGLFTHQWYHEGDPMPGQTSSALWINPTSMADSGTYYVELTDPNTNCVTTSDPVTVIINPVPTAPIISHDGPAPLCAAELITMTVDNIEAGVNYLWSTGVTGPTISTYEAGYYNVEAINTYGCDATSNTIQINALPDVDCVMSGCYEFCDSLAPITIPGPGGFADYEWLEWNNPGYTTADTTQNLEVSTSGSYQLVLTTTAGCVDTSDFFNVDFIDCDDPCGDLEISYTQADTNKNDDCCWMLTLENPAGVDAMAISLEALNGVSLDYTNPGNSWAAGSMTDSTVVLLPPGGGTIPSGSTTDFAMICLSDNASPSLEVVVNYLGLNSDGQDTICSDTLYFECEIDPGCAMIVNDSIYCEGDSMMYSFYVVNQSDVDISVIDLEVQTPPGSDPVILNPSMMIGFPDLAPGDMYGPITVGVGGPGMIPGETFCYTIGIHNHMNHDSASFCCHDTVLYCVEIPAYCDPCEHTDVIAHGDPLDCCWELELINNSYVDISSVQTSILTPGVTYGSINNPLGSGWTSSISGTSVLWTQTDGSMIPPSAFLPEICLDDFANGSPSEIEINWLDADGNVLCSDTVALECNDDCVVIVSDSIYCKEDGTYIYEFELYNNSDVAVEKFNLFDVTPATVNVIGAPITATIPPGTSSSFNVAFQNVSEGDVVCFHIKAGLESVDSTELDCCVTDKIYCVTIPKCCADGPQIIVKGSREICKGGQTELCVDHCCEDATFSWSNNGDTTACTTVTAPGTYTVKIECDGEFFVRQVTILQAAPPVVNLPSFSICQSSPPISLAGTPSGGIYSGAVVNSAGAFSPGVVGAGDHEVIYTYTDPLTGCVGSDTATIEVLKAPKCKIKSDGSIGDLDHTIYLGYGPQCLTLSANGNSSSWSYQWSTGETTQSINVCPTVSTTYTVVVTNANGCKSKCSIRVCVYDIRCKDQDNAIYMCQDGGTYCVPVADVQDWLNQGASLGPCNMPDDCFKVVEVVDVIDIVDIKKTDIGSYPNPFLETTTIQFTVKQDQRARVDVQDMSGRPVAVLFDQQAKSGVIYKVEFSKQELRNGMLVARIITEDGESKFIKLLIR